MPDEHLAIVVTTNLSIEPRRNGKTFAARLEELGLTAYGHTTEDARDALLRLFNEWANLHRRYGEGVLERRLDQLGAHHEPLDGYSGQLPVVDTREYAAASGEAPSPASSDLCGMTGLAA